jgi:hypothetical protein
MKKIICYIALLLSFNLLAQTPPQYNTITDLTFSDVDGQTHNLYNLINEGYKVILDFGFIGCGPCSQWSEYIDPEIWDEYGPDGDNSLRMFYFEVGSNYDDDEVEDYYSGNNTQTLVVPNDLEQTPTATTSELSLNMEAPADVIGSPYFSLNSYDGDELYVYQENNGTMELELDNGNCYGIQFANQQTYEPLLKDLNDNVIISLEEFAFFPTAITPFIYFNVNNKLDETGINSLDFPVELEYDINYFNLEGKKFNKNELSKLPNGSVYFRRTLSGKGTYSYK